MHYILSLMIVLFSGSILMAAAGDAPPVPSQQNTPKDVNKTPGPVEECDPEKALEVPIYN